MKLRTAHFLWKVIAILAAHAALAWCIFHLPAHGSAGVAGVNGTNPRAVSDMTPRAVNFPRA